jgi:RimJ/RimL family protein N-acetyltransferase
MRGDRPVSVAREAVNAPAATTVRMADDAPFRIYRRSPPRLDEVALEAPDDVTVTVWRPAWTSVPPAPIRAPVTWVWWLFHLLRVFRSRAFGVVIVTRAGRLLHRSTVFPPFFRFPFMGARDVQVGDTWTADEARGRGLAGLALRAAVSVTPAGGDVWYVVHESNAASIRVVEKAGFALVGHGVRRARFGLPLLGFYEITRPVATVGRA